VENNGQAEIQLPFIPNQLKIVRVFTGLIFIGISTFFAAISIYSFFCQFDFKLCLFLMILAAVPTAVYVHFMLSDYLYCDSRGIRINHFFVFKSNVMWERMKKIEFISEGQWMAIIKVYYDEANWGLPMKIFTRSLEKKDVFKLCELFSSKAFNAQVVKTDLFRK
jgi:hypothetical protein